MRIVISKRIHGNEYWRDPIPEKIGMDSTNCIPISQLCQLSLFTFMLYFAFGSYFHSPNCKFTIYQLQECNVDINLFCLKDWTIDPSLGFLVALHKNFLCQHNILQISHKKQYLSIYFIIVYLAPFLSFYILMDGIFLLYNSLVRLTSIRDSCLTNSLCYCQSFLR